MTQPHSRKIKFSMLALDGEQYECSLENWKLVNNTEDGTKMYVQCPGDDGTGEFREEAEPDWALELKFNADWRLGGISDFLQTHNGESVDFRLDHLYDIVGEHVRWDGRVKLKTPGAGGDVRTTEKAEITLPVLGEPVYSRP
jgi:hypothetical protein